MSPLDGIVFHPDYFYHLDTLTSSIVAPVFLEIASWRINRQRYSSRCMWNCIRLALAHHKFPSQSRRYQNIDLEFMCCPIHLDCQSRDINQSTENVQENPRRGANSIGFSSERMHGLQGSFHLLLSENGPEMLITMNAKGDSFWTTGISVESDLLTHEALEGIVKSLPLLNPLLLSQFGSITFILFVQPLQLRHPSSNLAVSVPTINTTGDVRCSRHDTTRATGTSSSSPHDTCDAIFDCSLTPTLCPHARDVGAYASETRDSRALMQVHDQDFSIVWPEEQFLLGWRQPYRRCKHRSVSQLAILDARPKRRKSVRARSGVPHTYASIVAC